MLRQDDFGNRAVESAGLVPKVTARLMAIGNRPGRVEPRAIKRRPKEHALLTKPRAEARAELLKEKPM